MYSIDDDDDDYEHSFEAKVYLPHHRILHERLTQTPVANLDYFRVMNRHLAIPKKPKGCFAEKAPIAVDEMMIQYRALIVLSSDLAETTIDVVATKIGLTSTHYRVETIASASDWTVGGLWKLLNEWLHVLFFEEIEDHQRKFQDLTNMPEVVELDRPDFH